MKLDSELAARFRDELFSEEDKLLLRSVVGNTYIDISDKLLNRYSRFEIRIDSPNNFIIACADLIDQEGKYILEQLRSLNKEIDKLMDYKNYRKRGKSNTDSVTNLINDFESKNENESSSGAFSYEFTETAFQNKAAALVRGASSQTSERNKNLDSKGRKNTLIDVPTQLVGKKTFDPSKILQKDKVLDVKEAHYEIIQPEAQEVQDPIGAELFSTQNLGITGNTASSYSGNNTDGLSVTREDGETKSESSTYSNTVYNVEKEYESGVDNDNILRVLRLRVPNLQEEFFSIFAHLFDT